LQKERVNELALQKENVKFVRSLQQENVKLVRSVQGWCMCMYTDYRSQSSLLDRVGCPTQRRKLDMGMMVQRGAGTSIN
jgi:hypothetical protein